MREQYPGYAIPGLTTRAGRGHRGKEGAEAAVPLFTLVFQFDFEIERLRHRMQGMWTLAQREVCGKKNPSEL